MRAFFATVTLLIAAIASCNGDSSGQCPGQPYRQGERCEGYERRTCPFLGSKCGRTTCTCENEPGGFRWQCDIAFCSCSCPCGLLVTASCDALNCSEPQARCPDDVIADRCSTICTDFSVDDVGVDAIDGGDAARDADGGDAQDAGVDTHDGAGDGASDGASDSAGDSASDAAGDAVGDGTAGG